MPTNEGFGQRAREARRRWALANDADLTFAEIGALVAAAVGRKTPYTHQAVRKWFVDGQEPDLAAVRALAGVLGVDPGWLAFGPGAAGETRELTEAERGPAFVEFMRGAGQRLQARDAVAASEPPPDTKTAAKKAAGGKGRKKKGR